MSEPDPVQLLQERLDGMRAERQRLDEQIVRTEVALQALVGDVIPGGNKTGSTARAAVRAALATFDAPVLSEQLMDHPNLVHYSRHTLRSALSDMRRTGQLRAERLPKGFLWDPESAKR